MKFKNNRVAELYTLSVEELNVIHQSATGVPPRSGMSKIKICESIELSEFQRRRASAKIPHIKDIF